METEERRLKSIELIEKERMEQLTKHGRTIVYDVATNFDHQLTKAAMAILPLSIEDNPPHMLQTPFLWDPSIFEKMLIKTYKERLIIAGALISAELDRVLYIHDDNEGNNDGESVVDLMLGKEPWV